MSDDVKAEWITRHLGIDLAHLLTEVADEPAEPTESVMRVWRDAKDTVDAQLAKLQTALRLKGTSLAQTVAGAGLAPFTRGLQVKLVVALMQYEGSASDNRAKAVAAVRAATAALRDRLRTERVFRLLDNNAFGVPVSVRDTLTEALDDIDHLLPA
jgi:hypothetical protein